jgi:NAD+ diphosphatase
MPLATRNLDRRSDVRKDDAWIQDQWVSADALVHVTWRGQVASDGPLAPEDVAAHEHTPVYLGELAGSARFAVDLSHVEEAGLPKGLRFRSLRELAFRLPEDEANVWAFASGIGIWHTGHRFCGACGGPTVVQAAGHERKCTSCGMLHFPRTDPAVIMLVHDGGERCLLGRQAIWPQGMYSTLAGFVEPGESLEDAVRRETMEEAGVPVTDVRYLESQPWPFPRSIMLGFHARALSTELRVDTNELEDARWFTAEELHARAATTPPSFAISARLIQAWLDTF